MSGISVLGAGAFGTALAISIARDGRAVTLWARDPDDMQVARENRRRLAGHRFPDSLTVTGDIASAARADILLLAVPMQQLAAFLAENREVCAGKTLVACCKGIDLATGLGPAEIIARTCRDPCDPVRPQLRRRYRRWPAHRAYTGRARPRAAATRAFDGEPAALSLDRYHRG
jgi:glycerol-3-phosphate dehydrogenase (NAD(P)+)